MGNRLSSPGTALTDSKFAHTARLLTAGEWRALRDWLRSPAVTGQAAPLRAYGVLRKQHPQFDLPKAALYRAVYGKKAYDNRTLNNLLSQLNRLTEDFLLHRRLLGDAERRTEALRELYRERGALDAHAALVQRQLNETTDPPADEWALLARLRRRHDAYFFAPEAELYADQTAALAATLTDLDQFGRLLRTKIEFERGARAAILGTAAPAVPPAAPHPIEAFYARVRAADPADLPALLDLERAYHAAYPALPTAYRRLFGVLLLNRLMVLNARAGAAVVPHFVRHVRFLDAQDLLARNGYLNGTTYLNVVAAAILGEDYPYAETLVERYRAQLPAADRAVIVAIARARVAVARGRYPEATRLAGAHAAGQFRFEVLRRMVGIKAAFEAALQNPAAAVDGPWAYALANFEKYLRRRSDYTEARRAPFLRFCLLVRQLGQALLPALRPDRLAPLRARVPAQTCYGKKWLLAVLDRYEKGAAATS